MQLIFKFERGQDFCLWDATEIGVPIPYEDLPIRSALANWCIEVARLASRMEERFEASYALGDRLAEEGRFRILTEDLYLHLCTVLPDHTIVNRCVHREYPNSVSLVADLLAMWATDQSRSSPTKTSLDRLTRFRCGLNAFQMVIDGCKAGEREINPAIVKYLKDEGLIEEGA